MSLYDDVLFSDPIAANNGNGITNETKADGSSSSTSTKSSNDIGNLIL